MSCDPAATLFIFDWDDTLLPSHWLGERNLFKDEYNDFSDEEKVQIDNVSNSVQAVLQHAQKYGKVIIITNSDSGWVALSCARYMPACVSLLETIKVLSARALFETMYGDDPIDWKTVAFKQEGLSFTNVLSIGDSECERMALKSIAGPGRFTKSLKIVECSDTVHIAAQLDLVTTLMEMIVAHKHSIDVCCYEAR